MNTNKIKEQVAKELRERLYIILEEEMESNERVEELYLEFSNIIDKEYILK